MRKIKFRGKKIDNNKWVYGYLTFNNNQTAYIADEGVMFCEVTERKIPSGLALTSFCYPYIIGEMYEVIPETVGQYTGIKDKNGKEIYKGDILGYDGEPVGVVKWIETLEFIVDAEFTGEGIMNLYHAMYNSNRNLEVIGNIFDNPELLEKE